MKKTVSLAMVACGVFLGRASAQGPKAVLDSFAVTWDEIQSKSPGTGGRSRSVIRQPTATLEELEMHVTTLPAGQSSHPAHTHPNEEVIIIREGTLDAFQNGKTTRVGPGAILFMASNQPHNVANVGTTPAVYHVINWKTAATPPSTAAAGVGRSADPDREHRDGAAVDAFHREGLEAPTRAGRLE